MWLITVRSRPDPDNVDYADVGGAYVNCWIDFIDLWGARQLAWAYIQDSGWIPEVLTGVHEVFERDCDEEDLEFYEEALRDGSAFVYHQWPADAEDANEDFEASA